MMREFFFFFFETIVYPFKKVPFKLALCMDLWLMKHFANFSPSHDTYERPIIIFTAVNHLR